MSGATGDRIANGEIILRGMTTLRNRRQLPDKPLTYVYDGLFSCAEQLDKDGVGVFRHFVGKDASLKRDGTYEITAMVNFSYSLFLCCLSDAPRLLLIEQVVILRATNSLTKRSTLWETSTQ